MEFLDPIRDALGGGTLSLWMIIGALVLVWLAVKAVKFAVKIALFAGAAAVFLGGTVPWAGADLQSTAADCARAAVEREADGWQSVITKRITVETVSEDAACNGTADGLSAGAAVVKLRSFFDLPFQTWDVTPEGADARLDVDDIPIPSRS